MMKKLSFVTLLAAVIQKVEENTGLRCYDAVPKDTAPPYYQAVFAGQLPEPNKTMLKERYQIHIHAVADGTNGSVAIFDLIQKVDEAMTEHIELPEDYELIMQTPTGAQPPYLDEDGTMRSIIGYDLTIFYGYKMKI